MRWQVVPFGVGFLRDLLLGFLRLFGEHVGGGKVYIALFGFDAGFGAAGHDNSSDDGLAVLQMDEVRAFFEFGVVEAGPGFRNEFFSFADVTGGLTGSLAGGAFNPGGPAADFAGTDVYGFAILHLNDFAYVMLIPGSGAGARGKSLPEIGGGMTLHRHVTPDSL